MNKEFIDEAYRLTIASATLENEADGARFFNATEKAMHNVEANKTIKFDGEVLTFVSFDSGKTRNVTKYGCHFSCDCGGGISYHRVLFQIISTADSLEKDSAIGARETQSNTEREAYFATLPTWIKPEDKFALWMMNDRERERWFEARSPYIKPVSNNKPETYGSIRI